MSRNGLSHGDAISSVALFAVSTASLFLLDIYLSATLPDEPLATWAATKSLLLIVSTGSLLGIDQAVLRRRLGARTVLGGLLPQISILTILLALVRFSNFPVVWWQLYPACVALGLLRGLSGLQRATYRISLAHTTLHIWKLVAVVTFVAAGQLGIKMPPELTLSATLAVWALASWNRELSASRYEPEAGAYSALMPVAIRFWVAAFVSISLMYLDQLVLNATATPSEAGQYFRYTTLFLPLSTFFASTASQLVNPYVRSHLDSIQTDWHSLAVAAAALSTAGAILSLVAGLVLNLSFSVLGEPPDSRLAAGMTALGIIRLLYVAPSAVVGVMGSKQQLSRLVQGTVVSVPVLAGVYYLMLTTVTPQSAILIALLTSATLRVAWSSFVALAILNGEPVQELSL